MTSSTGGQKGSKLERYDLIPVEPLAHVARVYGAGARKYADRNWEKGYDWSLSYAAMQRHANQFWGGEWADEETGCPHLASVIFHAMALMEYHETHPEFDDRPRVPRPEVEQPPKSMQEHLLGSDLATSFPYDGIVVKRSDLDQEPLCWDEFQ